MTSQDMQTLTLLLDTHFQKTQAQISQMRAENAEFKADILQAVNNFTENINKKFDDFTGKHEKKFDEFTGKYEKKFDEFKAEVNARFDGVQTQIAIMHNDITGLKHDVQNLYTWNYWTLAIIIGIFVLPQFGENLKKIFTALFDGVKFLRKAFKKN